LPLPADAGSPGVRRDRSILLAAAFLRALATGMIGVLLALYLAALGSPPAEIGLVVGAGLAGGALGAGLVTLAGDRLGRRRVLVALALLGAGGGAAAALASSPAAMLAAAALGMVNGMGRDRGGALILEQAILPATVADDRRTVLFAWYHVVQDVGHALGGLLAALPSLLERAGATGELPFRGAVAIYAGLLLIPALLYPFLSRAVEAPALERRAPLSAATRRVVWRISALFGLDGLAGGLLTTALLAFFFHERFGAAPATLGLLFFGARALNAVSHLGAAWLARRIGLVNTMVFTHIPSSLLLATVPFAPSFPVAAALFLLREGLVEMDVPTRQSYLMAIVAAEERTRVSGVTQLVRLGAWAIAPLAAGFLMGGALSPAPLWLGAGMKIAYDLLLYREFRGLRPPEERRA